MSQNGLVAFLDILGYQDIINNNLIDDVAKIISEIILKLPEDVNQIMDERINKTAEAHSLKAQELVSKFYKQVDARIISDSIILGYEIPADADKLAVDLKWFFSLFMLAFSFMNLLLKDYH